MYCRNCSRVISSRADYCPGCGLRPGRGVNYCHHCGAETNRVQEVCLNCGVRLGHYFPEIDSQVLMIIVSVIFPPAAVWIKTRNTGKVVLNVILCFFLAWIGGIIHALLVKPAPDFFDSF